MISKELKQALKRPDNYQDLSPKKQKEINKKLGILDWDLQLQNNRNTK